MPAVATELLKSKIRIADPASVDQEWLVTGAADFFEARDAIDAILPEHAAINSAGTLWVPLSEVEYNTLTDSKWSVTVRYSGPSVTSDGDPPDEDAPDYEFSTVGGTRHVSHSEVQSVSTYKPSFPLHERSAIAPDADGNPTGVDVPEGAFQFAITVDKPAVWLTPARALALRDLTYKRNDAPFDVYGTGEVLFLGIQRATRTGSGPWRITFPFAAQSEIEKTWNEGTAEEFSRTVPPFAYLDLRTETYPSTDGDGNPIQASRPYAAIVHEIYKLADFDGLGLDD